MASNNRKRLSQSNQQISQPSISAPTKDATHEEKSKLEVAKLQLEIEKLQADKEKVHLENKNLKRWYSTPPGIVAIVAVLGFVGSLYYNNLDYKLSNIESKRAHLAKEQAEIDRQQAEKGRLISLEERKKAESDVASAKRQMDAALLMKQQTEKKVEDLKGQVAFLKKSKDALQNDLAILTGMLDKVLERAEQVEKSQAQSIAERSQEKKEAAYEVTVVDVSHLEIRHDVMQATLEFNNPVPNGEAALVTSLENGRKVRMLLLPISGSPGQSTRKLKTQWNPKKDGVSENDLIGRAVKVYSKDFPPEMLRK